MSQHDRYGSYRRPPKAPNCLAAGMAAARLAAETARIRIDLYFISFLA